AWKRACTVGCRVHGKQSGRWGCREDSGRTPPGMWQAIHAFSDVTCRWAKSPGTGGLLSRGPGRRVTKTITAITRPIKTKSAFLGLNLIHVVKTYTPAPIGPRYAALQPLPAAHFATGSYRPDRRLPRSRRRCRESPPACARKSSERSHSPS